jgi:hypothetical protein
MMTDHFFAGFYGSQLGKLDGNPFIVPAGSSYWIMARDYATRRDRSSQIADRLNKGPGTGPAVTFVEGQSAVTG